MAVRYPSSEAIPSAAPGCLPPIVSQYAPAAQLTGLSREGQDTPA